MNGSVLYLLIQSAIERKERRKGEGPRVKMEKESVRGKGDMSSIISERQKPLTGFA
jgi:hypothetical protein